jgi:hypothetical protein
MLDNIGTYWLILIKSQIKNVTKSLLVGVVLFYANRTTHIKKTVSQFLQLLSKSSGSSSLLSLCKSKEGGGVRLKTQLSWFCILLQIVTTCFGLARPSSGRNVVHKGENTHNCLYTGATWLSTRSRCYSLLWHDLISCRCYGLLGL